MPAFNDQFCLLLPVSNSGLGFERVQAEAIKYGLLEKQEIHITIVGYASARIIKEALDGRQDKLHVVNDLLSLTNFSWEPVPEFYLINRDYSFFDKNTKNKVNETRTSIIQMVHMPGAKEFYNKLNLILGIDITPQVLHVTLYSKSTNPENMLQGIALNSIEEFEKLNPVRL